MQVAALNSRVNRASLTLLLYNVNPSRRKNLSPNYDVPPRLRHPTKQTSATNGQINGENLGYLNFTTLN